MSLKLELTNEELDEFKILVEQDVRNSVFELSHTDAREYKELIKKRIRILEQIATKLEGHCASTATAEEDSK